jgi:hypothetical protein
VVWEAALRRLPGLRLALDAALATGGLAAVATLLVLAVSAVDRAGSGLRPGEVATLVGPMCAAAGVALAVARSRTDGAWHAWSGLGVSPGRLLAPLLLLGAAGGLGLSGLATGQGEPSAALAPLSLPAPVPAEARLWPDAHDGWQAPDLERWTARPAALSTRALVARARADAPAGARPGVDRAELLRRTGWGLAWLLATGLGCWRGLVRTRSLRRGGQPGLAAASEACAGVLTWLLAVLVASAYASTITM